MLNQENKRAVVFDLDGTLTNTLEDIADAMNRALRMYGLPEWETDDYRYLVGNGVKILAQRAVRDRQEMAEKVGAEYQAWYGTHSPARCGLEAAANEPRQRHIGLNFGMCLIFI